MAPLLHRRTITFGDTDAAGIVYTPRYSHFCMEAAEQWFRDVIDYDWYRINTELGLGTPVVHMAIDFLGPLVAGDSLAVQVLVEKLGKSSVTLGFSGLNGPAQTPVFSGRIVFCCTRQGSGSMPVPAAQRQLIERYMADCELAACEP